MKTLFTAFDGALSVTEEAGVIKLLISKAASIGGGDAAGIVKVEGEGSVVLDGANALKLGEAMLNSKLPESLKPLALVVEGIVNQAITSIE